MSNDLTASMKTRLGDSLSQMQRVAEQMKKIETAAGGVTKESAKALQELRKNYQQTHKEASKLEKEIAKTGKTTRTQGEEIRKVGQQAEKAERSTGAWLTGMQRGVTAVVGLLNQVLRQIDQVEAFQAKYSQDIGGGRLELASSLAGMGITGSAQTRTIDQLENLGGAATQAELVRFVASQRASGMTPEDLLAAARAYSRLGGERGQLGGAGGQAFSTLYQHFGEQYGAADLVDYTLLAQQRAGGRGITETAARGIAALAPHTGLETALAFGTRAVRSGQERMLQQVAARLEGGADFDELLSGRDPGAGDTLNAGLRAIAETTGVDRGMLGSFIRHESGAFESYRGGRSRVPEELGMLGGQAREELISLMVTRSAEQRRLQALGPSATTARRERDLAQADLDALAIGAESDLDRIVSGVASQAAGVTGLSYFGRASGSAGRLDEVERSARASIEVRIADDQVRRLSGGRSPTDTEEQ